MAPYFLLFKIFGGAVILFLPGWLWSKVCWPKNQIDLLARACLSIGLSFATVSLTVYLLALTGLKPGRLFFLGALLVAIVLPTVLLWLLRRSSRAKM